MIHRLGEHRQRVITQWICIATFVWMLAPTERWVPTPVRLGIGFLILLPAIVIVLKYSDTWDQ